MSCCKILRKASIRDRSNLSKYPPAIGTDSRPGFHGLHRHQLCARRLAHSTGHELRTGLAVRRIGTDQTCGRSRKVRSGDLRGTLTTTPNWPYRTSFARPIAARIAARVPPAPAASIIKSRRSRSCNGRLAPGSFPFGGGMGIATSSTSYSPTVAGGDVAVATGAETGAGALASTVAGVEGKAVAGAFGSAVAGGLGFSAFFDSVTILPTGSSPGVFVGFASFFAGTAGSGAVS